MSGGELSLKRELKALQAMPRHPNVVSMSDYWRDPEKQKRFVVMSKFKHANEFKRNKGQEQTVCWC